VNPFPAMIRADAEVYVRERDLPKLLAVWPKELHDHSIPGTERLIARVRTVLAATHAANLRGHWSHDVNRHIALLAALTAEQEQLAQMIQERRAFCEAAE
jgi:hypothetical protein